MPNWTNSLQMADFEFDKDYYQRLQRDVELIFEAIRVARRNLEPFLNKPLSEDMLHYTLSKVDEEVEYLQKGLANLHEQIEQWLRLLPELIAERDRLQNESEHSLNEMAFLDWMIEMGLDGDDEDDD